MHERSKLVRMRIVNIGCVGQEGLTVELDDILCVVGPNNTGKSTVLRAYELAVGTMSFEEDRDYCKRAKDEAATIELWVHIPENTGNIAEKWKEPEGDLRLVRSRWEWSREGNWKQNRQTWDPEEGEYATDDKASGLDTVFSSRLPTPFRIGTLDDPDMEHTKLLTLILQPVMDRIQGTLNEDGSELNEALATLETLASRPVEEEKNRLDGLKKELNRSHNEVFPDLRIDFDIGLGQLNIDIKKLLLSNSRITFHEWASEIDWRHQGTGSQRALFWTMLQVRSNLNALGEVEAQQKRLIKDKEKEIGKLAKDIGTVKTEATKNKKREKIKELEAEISQSKAMEPQRMLEKQADEFSLPGYMLLIDEPEVALHPGAVRAASKYLYALGQDPAWQVIISTHSPLFIDPLQDHTTIVRLDRTETIPSPKTYRSDDTSFSGDEKVVLKMMNRFDQGLSEMFFGQHPLLVEGDTEFAVFEWIMNTHPDEFPPPSRPTIVQARGKSPLVLLVRMLSHFKIPFSILHDADAPRTKDGAANGAWTANANIETAVHEARDKNIRIVHRISVPDFEKAHLGVDIDADGFVVNGSRKDKPWKMLEATRKDKNVEKGLVDLLKDLLGSDAVEEPFGKGHTGGTEAAVKGWADEKAPKDTRFQFH